MAKESFQDFRKKETALDFIRFALNQFPRWRNVEANVHVVYDAMGGKCGGTLEAEMAIPTVSGLVNNPEYDAVFAEYYRRHPEQKGIQANHALLDSFFSKHRGHLDIDALEKWADSFPQGTFAKNEETLQAEAATKAAIATGTRQGKEMSGWIEYILGGLKTAKNPYSPEPGALSRAQYDAREQALLAMDYDTLKAEYERIKSKRDLKNLPVDDLKMRVRTLYEKQQQPIERFVPLPKEVVFEGQIHPTEITREVILWIQKNDRSRWEFWKQKYGLAALEARMEGRG